MTGMEHAIEQAAKVADDILSADPQVAREMFGDEPDKIARALAEAGLLAPAPLREEWATRFPNRHLRPGKDRNYDLWFKGDPPKGVNVRRYVTDWETP